ncbi:MAG: hypothetical protein KAH20_03955 [Methylococcales bacterium]|nr:hypothetical protein [Methylococcales bacterium]
MNTLVKITIPLFFLIVSGCAPHPRHYSNRYGYTGGGYSSRSAYPVYYDRDVYIESPSHDHRYDSYQRQYTRPNKHAKPHNRYNNGLRPNKHRKQDLIRQNRNNRQHNKAKKFVPNNTLNPSPFNSFRKQNNKSQKPMVNRRQADTPSFDNTENMNNSAPQQPASSIRSKHRKPNNNVSSQSNRHYSGKGSKR